MTRTNWLSVTGKHVVMKRGVWTPGLVPWAKPLTWGVTIEVILNSQSLKRGIEASLVWFSPSLKKEEHSQHSYTTILKYIRDTDEYLSEVFICKHKRKLRLEDIKLTNYNSEVELMNLSVYHQLYCLSHVGNCLSDVGIIHKHGKKKDLLVNFS